MESKFNLVGFKWIYTILQNCFSVHSTQNSDITYPVLLCRQVLPESQTVEKIRTSGRGDGRIDGQQQRGRKRLQRLRQRWWSGLRRQLRTRKL